MSGTEIKDVYFFIDLIFLSKNWGFLHFLGTGGKKSLMFFLSVKMSEK